MHDIFLSYSREDRARVSKLAVALGLQGGWSVWWDQNLRTGERFTREIEAVLKQTRCVLVVWSQHSVGSDWVCAEASEGWERGILVPVRLDDSEPPMPFRQTETADLSGWHGSPSAPALLKLVEDVQRALAKGVAASADELLEREARRRRLRRRRALRKALVAAAVVAAVLLGGLAFQAYSHRQAGRQAAERLAGEADAVREQVLTLKPEEQSRVWSSVLVDNRERLDRLELGILLAIEATRLAPTERALQSLRDSMALLPWSDWHLRIEPDHQVRAIDFSQDERLVAAGGDNGETLVWAFAAGKVQARIPHGDTGKVTMSRYQAALDFSPSESLLATAGPDATARLWDPLTGRELHRFAHDGRVTAVGFAPGGKQLASASADGTVRLWDVASRRELFRLQHGGAVGWAGFSPSGNYAVSAGGRSIKVWAVSSGSEVASILTEAATPQAASFSPNETLLAIFGEEVETTIWEIPSRRLVWRLPVRTSGNAGAVFSADGRALVIGDSEGTLSWWDIERRQPMFSVRQGAYTVAMAQSANRRRLVTSVDQDARVVDVDTGRELKRLPYAGRLFAAALTPDGQLLASSGWDEWGEGAIEVTRVAPDDPVAAACAKLSRNLTLDEWRKHLGDAPYRATCPGIEARPSP